ncbi:hypothetical protein ACVIGB_000140 [Bradyrhizobium sp. USDA 4341]
MGWANSYFRVERPFRVFKHFGMTATNASYGSSRIHAVVLEAINARPGDEIHALAGGTFLQRGDELFELSLHAPKPPFERGSRFETDAERLTRGAQRQLVSPIPPPTRQFDYRTVRESVSNNQLPDQHAQVIHREDSPEMVQLRTLLTDFVKRLRDREGADGLKIELSDIDAYRGPKAKISFRDSDVTVTATVPGVCVVDLPDHTPCGRFIARAGNPGRLIFMFRKIDGHDVAADTAELLASYAEHLEHSPSPGPAA